MAGFNGQAGSTSAFGNLSVLTSVSNYQPTILSTIGVTLVPEPSSFLLGIISVAALLRRRR
ncbi:MAG: hypothetical protein HC845_09600 [Akkermansiaceae bacterium]|nr:hypothetical protein [Akkermansiaceae bacterium]